MSTFFVPSNTTELNNFLLNNKTKINILCFTAPWCKACVPFYNNLEIYISSKPELKLKYSFIKINVDLFDLSQYNVTKIPCVYNQKTTKLYNNLESLIIDL